MNKQNIKDNAKKVIDDLFEQYDNFQEKKSNLSQELQVRLAESMDQLKKEKQELELKYDKMMKEKDVVVDEMKKTLADELAQMKKRKDELGKKYQQLLHEQENLGPQIKSEGSPVKTEMAQKLTEEKEKVIHTYEQLKTASSESLEDLQKTFARGVDRFKHVMETASHK